MPEVTAYDVASGRTRRPERDRPRDPRPLAGIPCCMDLPGREEPGPPLEEELPAGYLLDERFLLRQAIGRSGMATIYQAEDHVGGRDVAVKVPLMKIESDPAMFGRFQREASIGSALNDPLLLRFIPVDAQKSRPYIVTELLDGCTLAMVIHRSRPIPEKDALRIASVICEALAQMHARRIIHRDLKPANVMVCRDGRLCLMDFGLAAEIDTGRSLLAGLTPLFGTPEYMAPEQVRNRRNDERTDLYSLGVILYQMLTGVLPFQSEDPWTSAQMRTTGDPIAPRSLNPAISPEAEEIVLRAMRRRPADRYQTAAAFQAELDDPGAVHVTGLSLRLKAPSFRLSLQGTPFIAGTLIGVGFLLFLVGVFLFIARRH
jgi:serine/threonine protein kinase